MSGEVRLSKHAPSVWVESQIGNHIAIPAAEFEAMAAEARSYRAMLSALKAGDNAKLPFGQVMADLGLDEPPGEALMMEVRFE